jgi:hypothetical protein
MDSIHPTVSASKIILGLLATYRSSSYPTSTLCHLMPPVDSKINFSLYKTEGMK